MVSFCCFFGLQGLTLLELATHLEVKAAKLRHEGLGKVKIALAGPDTSSLLEILEGCFGRENLDASQSTISTEKTKKETIVAEETSNLPKQIPATPSDSGGLATMELVLPLRSIPMVIASLPKPLYGPKTLSHYRCQHPSCDQEFSQKAAACHHVCCDHLNMALACLYCSADNSPKNALV